MSRCALSPYQASRWPRSLMLCWPWERERATDNHLPEVQREGTKCITFSTYLHCFLSLCWKEQLVNIIGVKQRIPISQLSSLLMLLSCAGESKFELQYWVSAQFSSHPPVSNQKQSMCTSVWMTTGQKKNTSPYLVLVFKSSQLLNGTKSSCDHGQSGHH